MVRYRIEPLKNYLNESFILVLNYNSNYHCNENCNSCHDGDEHNPHQNVITITTK
jgi:hypothetical protein